MNSHHDVIEIVLLQSALAYFVVDPPPLSVARERE